MSERKAGSWWARIKQTDTWVILEFDGRKWCGPLDVQSDVVEVGPYIPDPNEMEGWQLVPVEADASMSIAGDQAISAGCCAQDVYHDMLAAVPRFGEEQ